MENEETIILLLKEIDHRIFWDEKRVSSSSKKDRILYRLQFLKVLRSVFRGAWEQKGLQNADGNQ